MSREPGDAPGLEWKKRPKDGARIPRWRARKKAVALGYRPSVIQFDIDPNDHAAIAERCRAEWAKMEAWLANERPAPMFDGTLASLIDLYSGDEESPYHDLRYRTQRSYDQQLKLLKTSVGARRIDKLNGEDFRRWYRKFREPKSPGLPPRIGRAHYGRNRRQWPLPARQSCGARPDARQRPRCVKFGAIAPRRARPRIEAAAQ